MVEYVGVHHPAFGTCDLDGTIRFWRDLLGMRLVYTSREGGGRQGEYIAKGFQPRPAQGIDGALEILQQAQG